MADFSVNQKKALALAGARKRMEDAKSSPDDKKESFPGEPHLNPLDRGASERMLGVGEFINNLGIGKHIGLPSNEILEGASDIAREQGKGTGIGGFIGEAAGDPLSWMGGAEFKAAKSIGGLAKAGAKYGAASGATSPGKLDKKGEASNKNIGENLKNAAEGGIIGAVAAPAIPAIAKGVTKGIQTLGEGFGARSSEELHQAAQQIRDEASASYKEMRDLGAYIHPKGVERLTEGVRGSLNENGIMNDELHKGTLSVLRQFNADAKNGISLEKADQYRRLLSGVVNDRPRTEDAKMASTAIRALDDAVDSLTTSDLTTGNKTAIEALNKARFTWAKARKFEAITDILEKSGNDPNRRKVLLEQFANNAKKSRGLTKEEKQALRDAAQNNTFEGLTKMAGKFGITLGDSRAAATGNVIPAVELLMQGTKKGLPIVLGGTLAKKLQNIVGKAKAERLLKLIESGKMTPQQALAQSPPNPAAAIGAASNPLAAP